MAISAASAATVPKWHDVFMIYPKSPGELVGPGSVGVQNSVEKTGTRRRLLQNNSLVYLIFFGIIAPQDLRCHSTASDVLRLQRQAHRLTGRHRALDRDGGFQLMRACSGVV